MSESSRSLTHWHRFTRSCRDDHADSGTAKKRLAKSTGSGNLRADAAQTNICAYMSWIALLLKATLHLSWADSVEALLLLPLILREADEARRGGICEC